MLQTIMHKASSELFFAIYHANPRLISTPRASEAGPCPAQLNACKSKFNIGDNNTKKLAVNIKVSVTVAPVDSEQCL